MSTCYEFAKDFAGPIATVCASVAAVFMTVHFNRRQMEIAETQKNIALDKMGWRPLPLRAKIRPRNHAPGGVAVIRPVGVAAIDRRRRVVPGVVIEVEDVAVAAAPGQQTWARKRARALLRRHGRPKLVGLRGGG